MNKIMNYNINKDSSINHFKFLFLEDLFKKVSYYNDPNTLNTGSLFFNLEELENKIIELFGEPIKNIEHFGYNKKEKNIYLDEKAFIYNDYFLCLKNKHSDSYFPDNDGPNFEYDSNTNELTEIVEPPKGKSKIFLALYTKDKITIEIKNKFKEIFNLVTDEEKRKKSELSILCHNSMDGFYLKNVKTLKTNVSIEENYNDDFKEVSEYIVKRLNNENDKGVLLLHGVPGSGKTNYIRYLTNMITQKPIIYIPPDFAVNISNPDFVAFFLDYENSILIIEDAENILRSRKSNNNQSVANLLSISDGLLGDGLKLQILCTFNSDINEIDTALLREGRLIAEYKFDKLSIEKSQSLLNKIYLEDLINDPAPIIDKEMTLAEIFNHKEKRFITKQKENQIGFRR